MNEVWIKFLLLNYILLVLLLYSYFFIFYLFYIFCALFLPFNGFIYIISLYNIRYSSYCSCSFFLNFHLLQSIRYLCSRVDYLFHISFLNCLTSLISVFSFTLFVLFFPSCIPLFLAIIYFSYNYIAHYFFMKIFFSTRYVNLVLLTVETDLFDKHFDFLEQFVLFLNLLYDKFWNLEHSLNFPFHQHLSTIKITLQNFYNCNFDYWK